MLGGESICCPSGSGLNINENGAFCSGGGGLVGCQTNGTWSAFAPCNTTTCGTQGVQTRTCIGPFFGGVNNCVGSATRVCVASTATNCTTGNSTSTSTSSSSSSTGPANSGVISEPFQVGLPYSCSCVCCLGANCQSSLVGSTGTTDSCDAVSGCTRACASAFPNQCPPPTNNVDNTNTQATVNATQGSSITVCRINGASSSMSSTGINRLVMLVCMLATLVFTATNKGL